MAVSVLRPESKAILDKVRGEGTARNLGPECDRPPFKVLPRIGGGFIVFDTRAPNGAGVVGDKVHSSLEAAVVALSAAAAGVADAK